MSKSEIDYRWFRWLSWGCIAIIVIVLGRKFLSFKNFNLSTSELIIVAVAIVGQLAFDLLKKIQKAKTIN